MTPEKRHEEVMLFAILLECLCQQVNMLEGQYRQEAKRMVNTLINHSRATLVVLHKDMNGDAEQAMGELFDFFYMVVRDTAQVRTEDIKAFRVHVQEFIGRYENNKEHQLSNINN